MNTLRSEFLPLIFVLSLTNISFVFYCFSCLSFSLASHRYWPERQLQHHHYCFIPFIYSISCPSKHHFANFAKDPFISLFCCFHCFLFSLLSSSVILRWYSFYFYIDFFFRFINTFSFFLVFLFLFPFYDFHTFCLF